MKKNSSSAMLLIALVVIVGGLIAIFNNSSKFETIPFSQFQEQWSNKELKNIKVKITLLTSWMIIKITRILDLE